MYNVTPTTKRNFELGSFNQFPPNYTEIPAHEFWRIFHIYTPSAIDNRQAYKDDNNAATELVMFFYGDNEGIGYVKSGCYSHEKGWGAPTKFFSFSLCEHIWKTVPGYHGRCVSKSKCEKCGREHVIDSSD